MRSDDEVDAWAASAALASALDGPLVSTQWLADHLGAEGLVVLDATVLRGPGAGVGGGPHQPGGSSGSIASGDSPGSTASAAFVSGRARFDAEGHIPGAAFADVLGAFSEPSGRFPFARPSAARFAAAAAAVGVGAATTVVVYDAAVGKWASRLWYLFRSFGHDRVAVLDGGAAKWLAEERPIARGDGGPTAVRPGPHPLVAREQPGFWTNTDAVAAIVDGTRAGTLVCGTGPADFAARHIPGSVSAPAVRLVDAESNAFLPESALRAVFADVLEAPGPVVAYSGAGIAATADALALSLLGRDDVLLYDGSLAEWTADPEAPVISQPAISQPAISAA